MVAPTTSSPAPMLGVALLGAGCAAAGAAVLEASWLVGGDLSALAAVATTAHAALWTGLAATLLLLPLPWVLRACEARLQRGDLRPAAAVIAGATVIAFSYGCYVIHGGVERWLTGVHVRAIAWSTAPPLVALALWRLARGAYRGLPAARAALDLLGARALITTLAAMLVLWGASLAWLRPEVAAGLDLVRLWALGLAVVAGLAAALWLRPSRRLAVSSLAVWTLLAGGALLHLLLPPPAIVRARVEGRTHATRLVFALARGEARAPVHHGGDGGAVRGCYPGQPMQSVEGFGQLSGDAPDVVLVTVDALRWDHTTMGGYHRDTTARLARALRSGAAFTQAMTPATSTRQTFRALFSGLHPSLVAPSTPAAGTGKWGLSFAQGQPTMAQYLQAAGFETTAIVADRKAFHPNNRGLSGFGSVDTTLVGAPHRHAASLQVDRIIASLSTPKKAPRFVWTHMMATHQPYRMGPRPKRWKDRRQYPDRAMNQDRYDAAIHWVDGELARLVALLRGPSRRDRTLLLIAADHGQAFGEHANRLHGGTVYGEEAHVPLLIWGVGVGHRSIHAPVSLLDIFPTVFEAAGLEPPQGVCGRSLWPLIRGAAPDGAPVYIEAVPDDVRDYFQAALIDGRFKLLVRPLSGARELYDLKADPGERDDLAQQHPQRLETMTTALRDYYRARGMDAATYGL